ncbi:hypothetical protein, partial [Stenotrophomonas maltophilia]|uniref:hypothetical protein n=1 Tax=Stenotrophomonas maltophilia TaxID=40324 RepID=UPI003144E660
MELDHVELGRGIPRRSVPAPPAAFTAHALREAGRQRLRAQQDLGVFCGQGLQVGGARTHLQGRQL